MSIWCDWTGSDNKPYGLSDTNLVDLRYRDGKEARKHTVGDLRWTHANLHDDIVAWRWSYEQYRGPPA